MASSGRAGTFVGSLDDERLATVLRERGLAVTAAGAGLRVEAAAVDVGRAAAEHGIVLTDLRAADGGLEDLFLELTADTQRDTVSEGASS